METRGQSHIFDINKFFWKIFGIWPGEIPKQYYKYYSFLYISITTVMYNGLLTLNLFYTPRTLERMIGEVIFFFTEVAVVAKIVMVLVLREKIISILKLIDCAEFEAWDATGKDILDKMSSIYRTCWRACAAVSNISYFFFIILPILSHFIWKADIELPICKYYFLSDEIKQRYFMLWFVYQAIGIYAHMSYNINIDSFISGLMFVAIRQLKLLIHNFSQIQSRNNSVLTDSKSDLVTLHKLLKHYDIIIKYCYDIQDIISLVMFIQFCMASAVICVTMFGLITVSSHEIFYGMLSYLSVMTSQIFVPCYLGTHLDYESQNLMIAAYNCNWVPQSEPFKRSLRLFISRANIPIVIQGLKIFPLSLKTFIGIMKMAYSFFTLLRKVQDREM